MKFPPSYSYLWPEISLLAFDRTHVKNDIFQANFEQMLMCLLLLYAIKINKMPLDSLQTRHLLKFPRMCLFGFH